jgi:2-phosphosulfolactate phosphatase
MGRAGRRVRAADRRRDSRPRSEVTADRPWSLSPTTLLRASAVADLVLPSPNGSTICAAAGATGRPVVAACLRNAHAVGEWLTRQGYGILDRPIGVVAAGERWPDGTLRPCVEDQLGAATVLDALSSVAGGLSVEAAVALAALASRDVVPVLRSGAFTAG